MQKYLRYQFVSEKVSSLNQFVKKNRVFARKFISGAMQLELDSVGRVNLPKNLLEYAGVKKDLILFALSLKKFFAFHDQFPISSL